jgi:hypothetical protein
MPSPPWAPAPIQPLPEPVHTHDKTCISLCCPSLQSRPAGHLLGEAGTHLVGVRRRRWPNLSGLPTDLPPGPYHLSMHCGEILPAAGLPGMAQCSQRHLHPPHGLLQLGHLVGGEPQPRKRPRRPSLPGYEPPRLCPPQGSALAPAPRAPAPSSTGTAAHFWRADCSFHSIVCDVQRCRGPEWPGMERS